MGNGNNYTISSHESDLKNVCKEKKNKHHAEIENASHPLCSVENILLHSETHWINLKNKNTFIKIFSLF